MRIAVWYNLPSGGSKRALYDHVRGLQAKGHVVEAWCPPSTDQTYLPLGDLVKETVVPLEWPASPRYTDLITGRSGGFRLIKAMHDHSRKCADEIDAGKFDLIFCNTCRFTAASPLARYAKTKTVLYLNEPYRRFYEACPDLVWLQEPGGSTDDNWIRKSVARYRHAQRLRGFRAQARDEKKNALAFHKIYVNSRFSRESLLRAYDIQSDVCYLGVDTATFSVGPKNTRANDAATGYVIGIGSFTIPKNIAFMIRAVATITEPRPRLIWIGNESDKTYLEDLVELAETLDVAFEPKVRVSDKEMVALLNSAFAFVYAPRLEPFGLTPIEAGACGLPVIGVAEGGVRETVEHGVTGLLVDHDPIAFGEAISTLRKDPILAATLGAQGRVNAVEKWSHKAGIDRLEAKLIKALHG